MYYFLVFLSFALFLGGVLWWRFSPGNMPRWSGLAIMASGPLLLLVTLAIFSMSRSHKKEDAASTGTPTSSQPPIVAMKREDYKKSSAEIYDRGVKKGGQVTGEVLQDIRKEIRDVRQEITTGRQQSTIPSFSGTVPAGDGFQLISHGNNRWTLKFTVGGPNSPKQLINTQLPLRPRECYYISTQGVIEHFRVGVREMDGNVHLLNTPATAFTERGRPFSVYRQTPREGQLVFSTSLIRPGSYTVNIEKSATQLDVNEYTPGVPVSYFAE